MHAPPRGTVYGTLLNYRGALAALGEAVHKPPYKAPPKAPVLYIKPANTWIGDGAPIPVPSDAEALQMGAALGVVIGRTACRVPVEAALDYVAGYVVVNDVSVPHDELLPPLDSTQVPRRVLPDRRHDRRPCARARIPTRSQCACSSTARCVSRTRPRTSSARRHASSPTSPSS